MFFFPAALLVCMPQLVSFATMVVAQDGPTLRLRSAVTATPSDAEHVVRSEVQWVNIYLTVRDRHGKFISGLSAEDFIVKEEGNEQHIAAFSSEPEPAQVTIALDMSNSQTLVMAEQEKVATMVLNTLFKESDRGVVVAFDSSVRLHGSSSSREKIGAALRDALAKRTALRMLDPSRSTPGRTTAVWDAVAAIAREQIGERRRKVVVLITDGEDLGSRTKARDAVEMAQRSDLSCYVLLVTEGSVAGRPDYNGEREMRKLVEATGGRLLKVEENKSGLEKSLQAIAEELRSQYSLAYAPEDKPEPGEYRKVQVQSRNRYKVRARKGYYASAAWSAAQ